MTQGVAYLARNSKFESISCAESANHRFLSVGAQSAGNMPKRSRISYGIKIGEVRIWSPTPAMIIVGVTASPPVM